MTHPILDPSVRNKLNAIYARLDAEIAAAKPVCRMSGECCNFETFEHIIFATTLELTNMLETKGSADIAPEGKLCPFWKAGKCSARDVRPLGCRVYFCDQHYQKEHSQRIYEKYHREIEALAAESDVEYAYVPMVAALRRYAREARLYDPEKPYDFS